MATQRNVILKNTLFNLGGRFGSLIVTLLFTPYLVHKLGPTQFGLWSVTLAIAGLVGLIDLGIAPALVKYVAELHSYQNLQGLTDLMVSGILIAVLMALGFIAIVWTFVHPIVKILQVPRGLESVSIDLIRETSIILGIAYLSNCLQSGLAGLQRMEFVNGIILISSFVSAVASFVLLELGRGLHGLIISYTLAACLALLLGAYLFIRLIPFHCVTRARPRRSFIGSVFRYGWKIQVATTCGNSIPILNKILTSSFIGLPQAGFFEIGNRVTNFSNSIPTSFFGALVPAWSELSVKASRDKLKDEYHRYLNYFLFLSLPFILFSISCAKPIVLTWIGQGFDQSVWALQILLVGYGINLQTGIGTTLLRGIGKPEFEMYYGLVTIVVNVFLAVVLGKYFGFLGILLGAGAGQVIGSVFFFFLIKPFVGAHRWVRRIRVPLGASILPAMLMLAINHLEGPIAWAKLSRWSILWLLIFEAMIFFGLFILLSLKSSVWRELIQYSRRLWRNYLPEAISRSILFQDYPSKGVEKKGDIS